MHKLERITYIICLGLRCFSKSDHLSLVLIIHTIAKATFHLIIKFAQHVRATSSTTTKQSRKHMENLISRGIFMGRSGKNRKAKDRRGGKEREGETALEQASHKSF